MADAGFDYKRISAAGSAVLKNIPATLTGYHVNSAYVGTVQIYDDAAGTTSKNLITIGTPNTVPDSKQLNIGLHQGAYYLATGTPDVTLFFE